MGYLTKDLPPELQQLPIDVFLSYSHGAFSGRSDNELKRWSQRLADDLREELVFSGIEDLSLFLDASDREDEGVDPTAVLSDQLQESVEGAAILTALMSPQYLRSKWCGREREWWTGRNNPDPLSAGGRLFLCRLLATNENDWPQELAGLFGYYFHDKDKDQTRARPFTWREGEGDRDQYNDALIKLSGDIAQRLKAAREVLDERHRHWQQQQKAEAEGGRSCTCTAGRNRPRCGRMPAIGSRTAGSSSIPTGPRPWPRTGAWTRNPAASSPTAMAC